MASAFIAWSAGETSPDWFSSVGELYATFAIYAGGFILMALPVIGLYVHAWRQRDALQLDALERMITRHEIVGWALLAVLLPPSAIPWPGYSLCLLAIVMPVVAVMSSQRQRRLKRARNQPI